MPIGIIVNVLALLSGGLTGLVFSKILPKQVCDQLYLSVAFCAISIGITSLVKLNSLTYVILSLVLGMLVGSLVKIEDGIMKGINWVVSKVAKNSSFDKDNLSTMAALFCFSCTGIFGALMEGIQADHSILLSKSIMDFTTALIFSIKMGPIVSLYAAPLAVIQFGLFSIATFVSPVLTVTKIANFRAVGGLLTMIIGYNVLGKENGWKKISVLNALPALLIILFFA